MLVSFILCVFMDQDEVEVNKYSTAKAWSIRIYYMTKLRVQTNAIKPERERWVYLALLDNQSEHDSLYLSCLLIKNNKILRW